MTNEEARNWLYENISIDVAHSTDIDKDELCLMMCKEALESAEKYKWHDLRKDDREFPEIVTFSESFNSSNAVEVVDDFNIYDTAMLVEHHAIGLCDKVYERNWYFGEGGKWEEFGTIRAWRYIKPFEEKGGV